MPLVGPGLAPQKFALAPWIRSSQRRAWHPHLSGRYQARGLPADGGSAADGPRCRWRTSPGIAAVFARAQPFSSGWLHKTRWGAVFVRMCVRSGFGSPLTGTESIHTLGTSALVLLQIVRYSRWLNRGFHTRGEEINILQQIIIAPFREWKRN